MKAGTPGDTSNLDFIAFPKWGDNSYSEDNWSRKRDKVPSSMLDVIVYEPNGGFIDYGNAIILQQDETAVVF